MSSLDMIIGSTKKAEYAELIHWFSDNYVKEMAKAVPSARTDATNMVLVGQNEEIIKLLREMNENSNTVLEQNKLIIRILTEIKAH